MTDDLKRKSKEVSDLKRENKRLKWKWKLGSWNGKAFYMESIWKMGNQNKVAYNVHIKLIH